MSVLRLSDMSSQELLLLFAAAVNAELSQRATKSIDELEKRGDIYDLCHGEFIT